MIPITQPYLPPLQDYLKYLNGVWERGWLTNNGPLVQELESKLREYLQQDNILFLASGTLSLQIAIKALKLSGEVITTPFSYIATTSTIVWHGCTPIFADIDPDTLNIDPSKIAAAITPRTSAILATHIYGNPCDIEAIDDIARRYGLKVIYDAAHCFGTRYKEQSVYSFGDVSITSFHATKMFHTVEGGAAFTDSTEMLETMRLMRNFGQKTTDEFTLAGINGKNSEVHAAMGLANLEHIDDVLRKYKELYLHYDERLRNLKVMKPRINPSANYNYAYCPLIFETEKQLVRAVKTLNANSVFPRRYFYPSLNTASFLNTKQATPVSEDISKRVLCLPLYYDLEKSSVDFICRLLADSLF